MIALPNYENEVRDYIDGVTDGSIVSGKLVRLAVQRHVDDLANAHKRGWKFDKDIAIKAIKFFPRCCRHSIGEWDKQQFDLSPWQMFIVWSLFGWRNIQTGYRRFRKAYISIARKNGKTTFAAGLSLLVMFRDNPHEAGAKMFCAATKKEQAWVLYDEAATMVASSPSPLINSATLRQNPKRIIWKEKNSVLSPLGSDKPFDGLNTHFIVLDELHAWRDFHRQFYATMNTGGGARRQPLMVIITTAGDDNSGIWIEEDEFCEKVLESVITGNIIDDTVFSFVARIDADDDPFDEAVWPKANPNFGVSAKLGHLRIQANEAKYKPTAHNDFLRYHCNVRVGSSERAVNPELWKQGNHPLTIADGTFGYAGLDIGRANDWCAIGACFPIMGERDGETVIDRWEIKAKAWTCRDGEFPVMKEPFRSWIAQGKLIACTGDQVDFAEVEREIVAWHERYNFRNWAFDPSFATAFAQRLQEQHGIELYKFNQTHRMYNEPVRRFLAELHAGKIWHGNEPVLEWQAGNLAIDRNARDEWMPDKGGRSSKLADKKLHKIDGIVAVLMAFAGAMGGEVKTTSIYSEPGNFSL